MSDTLIWPITVNDDAFGFRLSCNLFRAVLACKVGGLGSAGGVWADTSYATTLAGGNNFAAAIALVNATDIRSVPWGCLLVYWYSSETVYTINILTSAEYGWDITAGNIAGCAVGNLVCVSQVIVYPGQSWNVAWNGYNNTAYGGGASTRTMYNSSTLPTVTGYNSIPCNSGCVGTDYGAVETGTLGSLHLVIPTELCPDANCCPDVSSDGSYCVPEILVPCSSDTGLYSIGMNIPPPVYWSNGLGGGTYEPQAQFHM